jgi:predicted RNA-binding Zn ribbon-like protein
LSVRREILVRGPVFTPVDSVPLVGGRLCLDFVNTTGARMSGRPRERLASYADLLVWARRAGALPQLDEMRLSERARQQPTQARLALDQVKDARELLYRILRATLTGAPPSTRDLRAMTELAVEAGRCRVLEPAGSRLAWRVVPPERFDGVLWPMITDAADLLVSEEMRNARQCGECDWLFLDRSRNGRRRWCKKACGDRVKSRRYYGRRAVRALAPSEPGD